MKKAVYILSAAAALAACSKIPDREHFNFPERRDIVLSETQAKIVGSGNSFACNLLAEVQQREPAQEVFISPLSLQIALSMLANGAGGDTYAQIAEALGLGGYSIKEINGAYGFLLPALLEADASTKLALANAAWLNRNFPVKESFASAIDDIYDAEVENLDFASPEALREINSWAYENTEGMIPSLLESLSPDTPLVLANALYFKGIWSERFKVENTRAEDFHCASGEVRRLDFMHGDIPCRYAYDYDLSAAMCEIPFGNKAFTLSIILPDYGLDFGLFVKNFSGADRQRLREMLISKDEYLIIPKLDLAFDGRSSIIESLKALGMTDAFGAGADFGGISDSPLSIGEIIQKARFKMDEKGAEAAAATVVAGVTSTGPSEEFFADHPFIFEISETSTGTVLFNGTFRGI